MQSWCVWVCVYFCSQECPEQETAFVDSSVVLEGFPGGASGKDPAFHCRRQEMGVWSLGQEDPLEESVTTYPSMLAWRIPGTEEPGRRPSMGSHRVRHD